MTTFTGDFAPPPLLEEEYRRDDVFEFEAPSEVAVPVSSKSYGERAHALLDNKDRWKESQSTRSASLTLATLEQAAATDRQTDAILRQAAAAERQALLAEQLLTAQKIQNQLLFFAMTPADFETKRAVEPETREGDPVRESVFMQMKRNLGILPASAPSVEPADADDFGGDFDFDSRV